MLANHEVDSAGSLCRPSGAGQHCLPNTRSCAFRSSDPMERAPPACPPLGWLADRAKLTSEQSVETERNVDMLPRLACPSAIYVHPEAISGSRVDKLVRRAALDQRRETRARPPLDPFAVALPCRDGSSVERVVDG